MVRIKAGGINGQMERGRCCPCEDGCPITCVICLCHMIKELPAKHLSSSASVKISSNAKKFQSCIYRKGESHFPLYRRHFQSLMDYVESDAGLEKVA